MAKTNDFRQTYEEDPEALRQFNERRTSADEQQPPALLRRESLLRDHEKHLRWIADGNLPLRNLILPVAYPPSRRAIRDSSRRKIQLSDVLIGTRNTDDLLLIRTLVTPYVYSSTVTIVEDELGNVARITIRNLEDNIVDPIVTKDSVVAIKQPCWSQMTNGSHHIVVDHPSDFAVLPSGDSLIPEAWRQRERADSMKDAQVWKTEGDMMFLKKQFRKSLSLYDRGLQHLVHEPDAAAEINLYRKRCGVNIVLLRLDEAAGDLSKAVAVHARSNTDLASSQLTKASVVEEWLHNQSVDDPLDIASRLPRALKELAARIKFDIGISQKQPEYDFPVISSYVGPLTLHVDAANYVRDVEVRQTEKHGRGLFAGKKFRSGDIIMAEKAYALPGYFMQDKNSDYLLYNLGKGIAAPRPAAWLFKELVQKLRWNPSLRKQFFDMDDGGYWAKNGWELEEGEDVPIDVFRIDAIRRLNSFSTPTRSADLLNQAPQSNPELRNGFWVLSSYINHSCLPNAIRTFIGDIIFVRAERDIEAGEEILNQYVSPNVDINDRRETLSGTWGFECDCALCAADGSVDDATRAERAKRFEELRTMVMKLGEKGNPSITSIKKIARGLRELEALYAPEVYDNLPRVALVHPTLFLTEAWRTVGNVDKTIEYAQKMLRNFGLFTDVNDGKFEVTKHRGMINVETVRALKYLAEGYAAKGEHEVSESCLELGKQWFTIITGADVGAAEFLKTA